MGTNYARDFKCKQCRGDQLEEVMINVTVLSCISDLDDAGNIEYATATNEMGDVLHYQCAQCGSIIRDKYSKPDRPKELVAALKYLNLRH